MAPVSEGLRWVMKHIKAFECPEHHPARRYRGSWTCTVTGRFPKATARFEVEARSHHLVLERLSRHGPGRRHQRREAIDSFGAGPAAPRHPAPPVSTSTSSASWPTCTPKQASLLFTSGYVSTTRPCRRSEDHEKPDHLFRRAEPRLDDRASAAPAPTPLTCRHLRSL